MTVSVPGADTCSCLCSASHDPTCGRLLGCVAPVEVVVIISAAGSAAELFGARGTLDVPMCRRCASAWEAIHPRFVGIRAFGNPRLARLN